MVRLDQWKYLQSLKSDCWYFAVLQLVKSQKMPVKLVIGVETEKEKIQRKEFVFDNAKVADATCKLILIKPNLNCLRIKCLLLMYYECKPTSVRCFPARKGRVSANCFSKWRTNTLKNLNQTWSQCLLAPGTWVILLPSHEFESIWMCSWWRDGALIHTS